MKDQILPDNSDEAMKVVKEFIFCRVAALSLEAFEQLVGCSVEKCDRFEIIHYPASKVFKEMWFVWLDESRCIQLDTSQSDQS